jgi:O-acetyl-ADP-ribose deacetylase (regulator of RNase III)
MNGVRLIALTGGAGLLVVGLSLMICFLYVRRPRFVYTGSLVAWCLITLGIVLLLFSLFPDSTVTGTFEGFKVGGVIAAFVLIVAWLAREGRAVLDKDREVEKSQDEIKNLRRQLAQASGGQNQGQPQNQNQGPMVGARRYPYSTSWRPRRTIGLIAGNLAEVRGIDAWVNSENTNMQMASYFDRSVSAVIRYYGARRTRSGDVEKDLIAEYLRQEVGGALTVSPGSVYVTEPGSLADWGVKRIFHVAAVQGEAGHGYRPVQDLGRCLTRVLEEIDKENRGGQALRSVVFPLFGTGQAKGNPQEIFPMLVSVTLEYLRKSATQVNEVWFVAYRRSEFDGCMQVLDAEQDLIAVGSPSP